MADAKFCIECGSELEEGSLFCSNCGTKVQVEEDSGNSMSENYFDEGNRSSNTNHFDSVEQCDIPPIESKGRKKLPVGNIVIAIIVLIIAASTIFYFINKDKIEGKPPLANSNSNSEKAQTNSLDKEKLIDDTKNPMTYIPAANKKYTYYAEYTDGSKQTFDVLAGKLNKVPVLTLVTIIPESEADVQHVVKRNNGLYTVADTNIQETSMFLPNEITEGKEWGNSGVKNKILKTNEICDAGFKKFENCLLIEQNYEEPGYSFKGWYAPGVGLVKSVDSKSGNLYMQLKGITDMSKADVEAQLTKYSPNIDKVK